MNSQSSHGFAATQTACQVCRKLECSCGTTAQRILDTLEAHYGIDDPETRAYVLAQTYRAGHSYSVDTDRGDVEIGIDEGGPTTLEAMIEADRQMIADEDSGLDPDADIEIDRAAMTTNISGLPGFRILAD